MKLNLTSRFVLILLLVGLVPLLVLAGFSLAATRKIAAGASDKLRTASVSTIETIERNLFERYGDVQAFATNQVLFQHPMGSPEFSNAVGEAINAYVKLYGMYSLAIVTDAKGKVVAVNSVDAKGNKIDTSFLLGRNFSQASWFTKARDGQFTKSDILSGTVVEDVSNDPDAVRVYGPESLVVSYSAPITNPKGEFLGVWRNLADFGLVESIISDSWLRMESDGMPTAEFILTDKSGLQLARYSPADSGNSKSFSRDLSKILKTNIAGEMESAKRAVSEKGTGTARDFDKKNGHWHAAGYARSVGALGYPGLGWSVLTLVPESDLLADVVAANRAITINVVVAAILLVIVAFLVARSLTRPILACVDAMKKLAEGDLTARVAIERSDEIGTLATAFNASVESLAETIAFVKGTASELDSSANSLTSTATSQAAIAEETNVQANTVAAAGEELAANAKAMSQASGEITQSANTVAAAVEEMSASIQEVARNCAKESEIAHKADQQARSTKELMTRLQESANEIGKVVELINRIAGQTNLLALNATIEAASAGEAGRGFAVVANEVKELARQSATATEEIRNQVALIQENTGASVQAIDDVATIIEQVSVIAGSIAAAVEEQSATTTEIVRSLHNVTSATNTLSENVRSAAAGSDEVSRNIHGVSEASRENAKGAAHISTSATALSSVAETLSSVVVKFQT